MKWQTHTKVKYEDLTADQRREVCNGCGGKGGWIKPPHRIFFETSCNHHDYGYSCGGTEQDRIRSDNTLYRLMLFDCETLPWWKRLMYRPWCEAYYIGVRLAGGKFFYYGQKRWPVPA